VYGLWECEKGVDRVADVLWGFVTEVEDYLWLIDHVFLETGVDGGE
jgi:hypothetical protein